MLIIFFNVSFLIKGHVGAICRTNSKFCFFFSSSIATCFTTEVKGTLSVAKFFGLIIISIFGKFQNKFEDEYQKRYNNIIENEEKEHLDNIKEIIKKIENKEESFLEKVSNIASNAIDTITGIDSDDEDSKGTPPPINDEDSEDSENKPSPTNEVVNKVVSELFAKVKENNAYYEGWSTTLVSQDAEEEVEEEI